MATTPLALAEPQAKPLQAVKVIKYVPIVAKLVVKSMVCWEIPLRLPLSLLGEPPDADQLNVPPGAPPVTLAVQKTVPPGATEVGPHSKLTFGVIGVDTVTVVNALVQEVALQTPRVMSFVPPKLKTVLNEGSLPPAGFASPGDGSNWSAAAQLKLVAGAPVRMFAKQLTSWPTNPGEGEHEIVALIGSPTVISWTAARHSTALQTSSVIDLLPAVSN